MANEAYRAVFLRVHPTGKMVLSLTTESDGKEAAVRAARRRRARRAARSTSRSCPADTDRFGVGHGFNTSPSDGHAGGDRRAPPRKIRDKAQLLAGMALGAAARDADVVERRVGRRRRQRPDAGQDDRGHRALRARHRRAAARRRGRARRPDRLHATEARRASASSATSTSSATFSAPNSAE